MGGVSRMRSFLLRPLSVVGAFLTSFALIGAGLVATAPAAQALPCEGPNPDIDRVPASDYFPGYSRTAADVGKEIMVDEVLARAVDWKEANPTYCQSDTYPDRHGKQYRPDCSGFVSMTWHLDMPYTTITLMSHPDVEEIPMSEVQPGDALINAVHTELVWKVEGDTITTIGFGSTPVDHQVLTRVGADLTYDAFRYTKMRLITDEMIREAIRENVPKNPPVVQPPNGRTMVNWPTLFSSDVPDPWREVVDLGVGARVELEARPVNFLWRFGDGETRQTEHPGVAYGEPGYENEADRILHRYQDVESVEVGVDITWSGYRYRIIGDDGPEEWQDVDGEHVSTGETTPLEVISMQSVLIGSTD